MLTRLPNGSIGRRAVEAPPRPRTEREHVVRVAPQGPDALARGRVPHADAVVAAAAQQVESTVRTAL